MILPHVRCGIGLLVASLAVAGWRPAHAAGPSEDATALIVQADAAHDAGSLAEAADLYGRAYRAMSAEERESMGEFVVEVALDDLRASWKKSTDRGYAEAAAALLDDYERDTGGTLPGALAEHRTWIDEALAEAGGEPAVDPDEGSFGPEVTPPPPPPTKRRDRPPGERDVVAPVLIGVGAAAAIGGAVMIALGAPLGKKARSSRDEALADPRLMDATLVNQMAFAAAYDDYVDAEKKRGTGLVAGGAVLIGAGIGVAAYGVVRLVQARKQPGASARLRSERPNRPNRPIQPIQPIMGGFAF